MYITSVSVCTYKYEPSVFAERVASSERNDLGHHYTISFHTNSINFVNVHILLRTCTGLEPTPTIYSEREICTDIHIHLKGNSGELQVYGK